MFGTLPRKSEGDLPQTSVRDEGAALRAKMATKATHTRVARSEGDLDEEVCWICLEGSTNDKVELIRPCKCPRVVHARCMARWQLQCSGKDEELHCKFCNQDLPNWRKTLFRDVMDDDAETRLRRRLLSRLRRRSPPRTASTATSSSSSTT